MFSSYQSVFHGQNISDTLVSLCAKCYCPGGMAYGSLLSFLTGFEVWASISAHSGLNASFWKNVAEQNSLQPHKF